MTIIPFRSCPRSQPKRNSHTDLQIAYMGNGANTLCPPPVCAKLIYDKRLMTGRVLLNFYSDSQSGVKVDAKKLCYLHTRPEADIYGNEQLTLKVFSRTPLEGLRLQNTAAHSEYQALQRLFKYCPQLIAQPLALGKVQLASQYWAEAIVSAHTPGQSLKPRLALCQYPELPNALQQLAQALSDTQTRWPVNAQNIWVDAAGRCCFTCVTLADKNDTPKPPRQFAKEALVQLVLGFGE